MVFQREFLNGIGYGRLQENSPRGGGLICGNFFGEAAVVFEPQVKSEATMMPSPGLALSSREFLKNQRHFGRLKIAVLLAIRRTSNNTVLAKRQIGYNSGVVFGNGCLVLNGTECVQIV